MDEQNNEIVDDMTKNDESSVIIGWLQLYDARYKIVEGYRQISADAETVYAKNCNDANKSIKDFWFAEWIKSEFAYLAEKYRYFWPDTLHLERLLHHFRPNWRYFTPIDFEHLVRDILYLTQDKVYAVTQRSHDHGVDLYNEDEELSRWSNTLVKVRTVVQCKLYRDSVGVSAIRDLLGVMALRGAQGLLFTTGTLTRASVEFVEKANQRQAEPRLHLVGREKLNELIDVCLKIDKLWQEIGSQYADVSQNEETISSLFDRIQEYQDEASQIMVRSNKPYQTSLSLGLRP